MRYVILFIGLCLVSCATVQVSYDYDRKASFVKYKTYDLVLEINTGLNELDEKRLFFQLDSVLQSRGFSTAQTPDFYINIKSSTYETQSSNTIGVGVAGGGRNVGVGVSGGIPVSGNEFHQEFIIDFLDGKTKSLFWQAIATSKIKVNATPEQRKVYFRNLVATVLKKYPPEKK